MKNENNGPYTKALYQLLARLNNNEFNSAADISGELDKMDEWMQNGRYYYTAATLRMCKQKSAERWDPEALKATLLKLMHAQNE